jgi:hypothetical protein
MLLEWNVELVSFYVGVTSFCYRILSHAVSSWLVIGMLIKCRVLWVPSVLCLISLCPRMLCICRAECVPLRLRFAACAICCRSFNYSAEPEISLFQIFSKSEKSLLLCTHVSVVIFSHSHCRRGCNCYLPSWVLMEKLLIVQPLKNCFPVTVCHCMYTLARRLTIGFRSDWQVVSPSGRISVIYLLTVFF